MSNTPVDVQNKAQRSAAAGPSHQMEHENSVLRKLLDSPFILLVLCILITFTSYTIWGVIELQNVPPAVLPQ